jgi:hypothetical protein
MFDTIICEDTVEYAVAQFMKAHNKRQSTTEARNYINRCMPCDTREANKRIRKLCKTMAQQPITNQSYRG